MYDYHLHSNFSGDCTEEMEETILHAIKIGGKQLCFTDHLDYDYPTNEVSFEFDAIGFDEQLKLMQKKYGDKLLIQKGIELGLQPHLAEKCTAFIKVFQPDFVLCSFHVADAKDLYNGDFYLNKTSEESWMAYLEDVLETLKRFKHYSVVGHLDIPKRYDEETKAVPFCVYKEMLSRVLQQIIIDNKGIEVNMSGLRTPSNETLPSRDILELYHELGGTIITIGSDAHRKEDIYSHFKETLQMLSDIGFTCFTVYEAQKPVQLDIKTALENF